MVHKNGHYAKQESRWLRPLLGSPAGALAVHWLFQGLLQMDTTERAFKLGLDTGLTLAFGSVLRQRMTAPLAYALSWLAAHTLNFLANGQIYGVLKHFGGVRRTWDEFNGEVEGLTARAVREPGIEYAAAYGSLARSAWTPTSDLDVRLVRAPGISNALRASWFGLAERSRALVHRFPLDLLVLDSYRALDRMAERKTPVVLVAKTRATDGIGRP